ncbi:MAG: hypothetical protein Q9220_007489 [cf. Caloplaca sp. 1 TL-2023]
MDPPLGTLPAERYLLVRTSTPVCTLSPSTLYALSANTPPSSSPDQNISQILTPWRTPTQRRIATQWSMISALWLRTSYFLPPSSSSSSSSSSASDARHNELIHNINLHHAVDGPDRLLNDPTLYSHLDRWQDILLLMPEILDLQDTSEAGWNFFQERQESALRELRDFERGGVDAAPARLRENLAPFRASEMGGGEEVFRGYVARAMQSAVHESFVVTWIVLEDFEAHETGEVKLMFLDARGRVVRWKRVDPGLAEMIGGFWVRGSWGEVDEWVEGKVAESYKEKGGEEGMGMGDGG